MFSWWYFIAQECWRPEEKPRTLKGSSHWLLPHSAYPAPSTAKAEMTVASGSSNSLPYDLVPHIDCVFSCSGESSWGPWAPFSEAAAVQFISCALRRSFAYILTRSVSLFIDVRWLNVFTLTEPIGDPYLRRILLSKMDNKHSPKSMLKMDPCRICKACNKKRAGSLPENDLIKVLFSMKIFFLFLWTSCVC